MADTIGYQFQPGADDQYRKKLNGLQLGPLSNEALRVISLNLPSVLAGRPISPDDLLRPNVGGVAPSNAVLDSLRRVSGIAGLGSGSESSRLGQLSSSALNPGGSAGAPVITPGGDAPPRQPFPADRNPTPTPPRDVSAVPGGGFSQPIRRPPYSQGY